VVERGESNLSLDSLERIAKTLGLTPAQLLAEAERER
jgi:transcriptional regulator with XRE-family HTH domain